MNQGVHLRVSQRSPSSFWTVNSDGLVTYLEAQGYRTIPSKTMIEFKRLMRRQAIVTIYRSGSISCSGPDASAAISLLETLGGGAA